MPRRQRAAILPTNIALLQNLVRRDPESYKEEFEQQYSHYESLRDIFLLSPSSDDGEEFAELIGFVSAVCPSYPKETESFPQEISTILSKNFGQLSPALRAKIVQCLVMLRNRNVITPEFLLHTLFPLLFAYTPNSESGSNSGFHVKELRNQIYGALISLLKSCNTGTKNQKLNRTTQALLFNLLDQKDGNGLWATKLTRELWRRGIWDDSRTVEIMTQACLHPDTKVVISGVKFFLGSDKEREEAMQEEIDEDDDDIDPKALIHKMKVNRKSTRRGKQFEAAIRKINKKRSSKNTPQFLNFSAIQLLRDPQQFAEDLFQSHLSGKNSKRFTVNQRIAIMILDSRLIGMHKLSVLGLYSYFLKYLNPRQSNVTFILGAAAQATHDLVPPEITNTVVKRIADEFVSDGVSAEVASTGLNTIREILSRNPAGIDRDLLQDLTAYKSSKSKAVMAAARSLISLYREVAPEMLSKKDRGKVATMELSNRKGENSSLPEFGVERDVVEGIPGLERLAEWKQKEGLLGKDSAWEEPDEDEKEEDFGAEIEGNWIDVKQDDKPLNIDLGEGEVEEAENGKTMKGIKKKYLKYMLKSKNRKKRELEDEDSDLELSDDDNDDDKNKSNPSKRQKQVGDDKGNSEKKKALETLMSTVLTPADFEKLKELNEEAGVQKKMGLHRVNEDTIDSNDLVGYDKHKQTKEERLQSVMEGREGREKFGSGKGKIMRPHSSTNKQKARKKNFMMMIHNRGVQGKKKMSLRQKQRVLRAHIKRQKRGY